MRDGAVVVPLDDGRARGPNPLEAGAGLGATPHQIAQADQRIMRLGQYGIERRQVAVNVRENERSHAAAPRPRLATRMTTGTDASWAATENATTAVTDRSYRMPISALPRNQQIP